MYYVIDTHYLVWYILGKVPSKVNYIFKQAEQGKARILIPTIVLTEILYLVKHKKIVLNYSDLIRKIEISENMKLISLDIEILKILPEINLDDIHDQIIVATAQLMSAKLITNDTEIRDSGLVDCLPVT